MRPSSHGRMARQPALDLAAREFFTLAEALDLAAREFFRLAEALDLAAREPLKREEGPHLPAAHPVCASPTSRDPCDVTRRGARREADPPQSNLTTPSTGPT